jgi:ATP/maltotriose-dependent transcriptional regulator MalT
MKSAIYQLGDLQEAEHQVRLMIAELEKTFFSKLKIGLWCLFCLPDILREKGDFSSAEALLEQLNPILYSEEIETLPKLFVFLAKWSLCLSQGHYQAAEKSLNEIESIELNMRFSSPFASGSISGMRARTQLMAGNITYAKNWLLSAEKTLNPTLFMYHLDILTAIGVYYRYHDFEPAQALASKLLSQAKSHNWKVVEAKVLLLQSAIAQAMGHAQEARHLLSQSLDIGYIAGYRSIYIDTIKLMGDNFYLETNDERYLNLLNEFNLFVPITAFHPTDGEEEGIKPSDVLSNREIQLLECIKNGFGDKEISSQLFISTGTVKTHLRNIFRKLNAKNRAHALAIYSQPSKTN